MLSSEHQDGVELREMIRMSVLLCLMLTTVSVRAETIQRLERDTSSPSLVDLSNGEPGWGGAVRGSGAPGASGADTLLQNSAYWGTSMQIVSGYVRRDGTYVPPSMRPVPRR